MKKILALWAAPRSTSTAFETMMRERGDFMAIHEPFGYYFYYSEERKSDRYTENAINPAYNFQPVFQDLIAKAQSQPVFIKDMAHYISDRVDETFLSYFDHTFIIRHPAKALPSLFTAWPDFSFTETGYAELYQLFELTKTILGKIPPLIDSDDLVRKSEATVKAYCDAVGIEFIPQALVWESKERPEVLICENFWHDHLQSSQGFKEREKKDNVRIEECDRLKQAYEYCLPYYQKLYEHRLRIE
ncbi:MAG: sulfotransferase family protein [Okeania sp. SIO3I5]|uniref:sulfotransferase-like domain-containing protein n=1 Tax=Okeania sp. SIO3I5 TaxID=2607805 RepID=UPI0013B6ED21|nr:sulfotransferase family protein [Okeania sp. SIO3I5]NEQ40122.1 sulfotransferase family protein [Okeania sp. SIO3I5]